VNNPFTDLTRTDRWETGLPELNMDQLRAPSALDWVRREGKPSDSTLGTFALSSMFNDCLIALIIRRQYAAVIVQLVRTWPELLTLVTEKLRGDTALTGVRTQDNGQRKPLAALGKK
jgi:alpha-D-ribose 1-methylphosphonate 5-triphosphate synthase subunit PhnI